MTISSSIVVSGQLHDLGFVKAGLKREARLRAICPGHPRLL
jgi:hypothetical protein